MSYVRLPEEELALHTRLKKCKLSTLPESPKFLLAVKVYTWADVVLQHSMLKHQISALTVYGGNAGDSGGPLIRINSKLCSVQETFLCRHSQYLLTFFCCSKHFLAQAGAQWPAVVSP